MSIDVNAGVFNTDFPDQVVSSGTIYVGPGDTITGQYTGSVMLNKDIGMVPGKSYRIMLVFGMQQSDSWTLSSRTRNTHNLSYFVIVGGKRYEFSQNVWDYMIVSDVYTDNITLGFVDNYTVNNGTQNSYYKDGNGVYSPLTGALIGTKFDYTFTGISYSVYEVKSGQDTTIDKIQQGNDLQQAGNDLQQAGNQLQQEGNQLQQEANQTSKNIFDKISDFFAGFFDGIINAFKSLFVPDDDYFADYFRRLNDFFASKLGMLYSPIDMFLRVMDSIVSASSAPPGIPFPGLAWEGTYIIQPQSISLATVAKDYPDLQQKLYFVTDVIMIGGVLMLLQNKLKEVLQR